MKSPVGSDGDGTVNAGMVVVPVPSSTTTAQAVFQVIDTTKAGAPAASGAALRVNFVMSGY